ncbi:matrixin family metalloprotease [Paenibacillus sp. 1001270B_150601_E10]|uniref:matrixin family metalloprotease n=1 Tax=Paenibacillus sp. 1001270B_150601_E10 TaxID=2787079 RepID=UPI00189CF5DD|nr:matrixin family metalloprotease [Paenibacillus sp. 1001270B_150601_E10]
MIKKTKVIIASLIALSAVATVIPSADATVFGKTRNGGGQFSAWYDASVSQKGYTTYFDYARSQWSGISTKVSISTTTNPTTSTDQYYVSNSIVADRLGQCISMSKTTGEVDPNVKNWDYSMVYMFDNNIVLGGYNNDTNKKNTALHEVGHSLGLAHTNDINSTLRSQSVMTDGSDTFRNRNITSPSTYDKGELKYKWGN